MNELILDRVEWFDERFYKIQLADVIDYYISVTTVLGIVHKPWLIKWYADLGYELASFRSLQAKIKGSLIHELTYRLREGESLNANDYKQDIWKQVWNYKKFHESFNPRYLGNELTVCSHETKSAGTLDILCYLEGGEYNAGYAKPIKLEPGYYVFDVKTGAYESLYHSQTAAYAKMIIEMRFHKITEISGTGIILLDADTKQGWKVVMRNQEEMAIDYAKYDHLIKFKQLEGLEKPKIFDMPITINLYEE